MTVKHYNKTGITLTDTAKQHIKNHLQRHPGCIGFRLSVKDAGCNSKKYVTEYVQQTLENDTCFVINGLSIFISKADLLYLAGTKIDYVKEGINHILKFNNPNVTTACGCGESFNIT